jgi:hypothetical protein
MTSQSVPIRNNIIKTADGVSKESQQQIDNFIKDLDFKPILQNANGNNDIKIISRKNKIKFNTSLNTKLSKTKSNEQQMIKELQDHFYPIGSAMRDYIEMWKSRIGFHCKNNIHMYTVWGFKKGRNNGATVVMLYGFNNKTYYNFPIQPDGRIKNTHTYISIDDLFLYKDELNEHPEITNNPDFPDLDLPLKTYLLSKSKEELVKIILDMSKTSIHPLKIYINCPFNEKNECKKLGGKWDNKQKKWYITDKMDILQFSKWMGNNTPN